MYVCKEGCWMSNEGWRMSNEGWRMSNEGWSKREYDIACAVISGRTPAL
jgi:hypothetical protein